MSKKPWFEVDREGLAEIVLRRGGLAWLIQELISNSWDESGVTKVDVTIEPVENSPHVELTVIDDSPNGFQDLSHAWTLFAKSNKRGDAEKRGRFNLGEKLVLAFCKEASITTTTGSVLFDARGRTTGRSRRETGSEFFGVIRMTRDQLAQALIDLKRLIPPPEIITTINGERLDNREPIATWGETLWTELPDEDTGALSRRFRHCEIRAFKPRTGEVPMLYEMGIPVVALDGDPLHIDVRQKVPLNLERDNVTPSYLRELRATVLAATHDKLDAEALRGSWATDAMGHYNAPREAVNSALVARFGDKRVSADPSDREAENRLKASGHTIVHGGSLPKEAWERVRDLGLMQPAGQVSPTPRAYSDNGPKVKEVELESLSRWVQEGVIRYHAVARVLLGRDINIILADEPQWLVLAVWHQHQSVMVLNVGKLTEDHFMSPRAIYALAIHEIAHEVEVNHLDARYHDELCRLGAELAYSINKVETVFHEMLSAHVEKAVAAS